MKENNDVVIYVDDSPSAREVVKEGFEGSGYLLRTATGVLDLENRLLSDPDTVKKVRLFIFDFEMPYLTGTQIASAMDKVYKELQDVPFVIFSGRPKDDVHKAIEDAKKRSESFARNYRGFIEKKKDSVAELVARTGEILNESSR